MIICEAEERAEMGRIMSRVPCDWYIGEPEVEALLRRVRGAVSIRTEGTLTRRFTPPLKARWNERWEPELVIPACSQRPYRWLGIMHELGHVFLQTCLAVLLAQAGQPSYQLTRLLRRNQMQEECTACAFATAYVLPPALFRRVDDDLRIARRSRLPLALVTDRRRALAPLDLAFDYPPAWCAARHYRAAFLPGEQLLAIAGPDGADHFACPVAPHRREAARLRITADLVAFLPDEFARKWRDYPAPPGYRFAGEREWWDPDLPELRRWAIDLRLRKEVDRG